jgi:hypothetical protein
MDATPQAVSAKSASEEHAARSWASPQPPSAQADPGMWEAWGILARVRELLAPRLPDVWAARLRQAGEEIARSRRHCQRLDLVGMRSMRQRITGRLRTGLGIRSGLRHLVAPPKAARSPLGAPSRFVAGDWVAVKSAEEVRATLDAKGKLRGLSFVPAQWQSCGRIYRVQKVVRRLMDDARQMRPVGHTVLLEGANCDSHEGGMGCGRRCPLMFRDDWLSPAEPPVATPASAPPRQRAWVRSLAEIEATLDARGRRDGVTFMPEMARFAGLHLPVVCRLPQVFELDRWTPPRAALYLLEGASCEGTVHGDDGPCQRACALMWHADWLRLDA